MLNDEILKNIIGKPKPLSDEQKKALLSKKNYVKIIAGAGTGKTETLTRRIAYLLLYLQVDPSEVVAFTFTEKAAQSMKSRIYERVRQLQGDAACARLGEMYVGTIHGFCLRILEDHFGYDDHDVLDQNQEMAFILREGWDLGLGSNGKYAEDCRDFMRSINVVNDVLINRKDLKRKNYDFFKQLELYENLLSSHRLLTFGRMIYLAVQKLRVNQKPIQYINHLVVDEYQDINKAQEVLIRLIGANSTVFIVGDPRQSIYQWRGSDETCFERFSEIFPGCHTENITENRRSVEPVIRVANDLANEFEGRKYVNILPKRKAPGDCFIVEAETPEKEAEWVVSQIEEYVESGRCNYKDIGILLRSVTTSGGPFIDLFRGRNIPYLVGGKVGLFRREEAKAVGRLFVWLYEKGFWVENPWNWADKTAGKYLFKTALEEWSSATGLTLSQGQQKELLVWKKKVLTAKFMNFTQAYQELLITLGYLELDHSERLDAAIMANLGRFNTLLSDYESSLRFGGRTINWPYAMKSLCWYINTYATGAYDEKPSEDIRGINAVQIMTVHQAKGLEWPLVFLPCLVDRRFPSSMAGKRQHWFVPRDMFAVQRYEGGINDEKKLFYVAITRAKDVVCLSRFRRINQMTPESQFIHPIRKGLTVLRPERNMPLLQLSKSSDEEEIQTFSAGEILNFMKCPHFYRLRELWNYQPGLVTQLGYGRSLHYCLRHASELIKLGEIPQRAILKAVEDKFHLPYAGGRVRQDLKNKAERLLSNFVSEHLEDMNKIDEVEARLEFPVQKATITGRVDVIMKEQDSLEARDYKTSDEATTFEESALQVTLYSLGLKNIGKRVTKASIATLEEARITPVDISDENIQRARLTAERSIEGIRNGAFSPIPGRSCKKCDYSRICRTCE